MGIYCDRRLAESRIQDHVGRFAAHTGQLLECITIPGNLRAVLVDEYAASLEDVGGLRVEKADRADIPLESRLAERKYAFRRVGRGKKLIRGLVDANVRGLRR